MTSELPNEPISTAEVEEGMTESFADLLKDFEKSHSHRAKSAPGAASRQLEGTVVSANADQVFLDIGYKTEGVLPRTALERNGEGVKAGDVFNVSVTGRNEMCIRDSLKVLQQVGERFGHSFFNFSRGDGFVR